MLTSTAAVLLFAYTTRVVLSDVALQVYPMQDDDGPPMVSLEVVEHANAVLDGAGLTSWFGCPLDGRVTNKMVTLADGFTYDVDRVLASCRNSDTLESPRDRSLTIPASLPFAFMNLDLMDIVADVDAFVHSLGLKQVPEAVRRWIRIPLQQSIWICKDGRSQFTTSIERPVVQELLGMLLVDDAGEVCFRNRRLESVVDHVCTLVDCRTAGRSHGTQQLVAGSLAGMGTDAVRLRTVHTARTTSSGATETSSSHPSTPNQHVDEPRTSTAHPGMSWTVPARDASPQTDPLNSVPWLLPPKPMPAPSLPSTTTSAYAATLSLTRSLSNHFLWDWSKLVFTERQVLRSGSFWAYHYSYGRFKPPGMSLQPRPSNNDDFTDWQASCLQFFQAAEEIAVNAVAGKLRATGQLTARVMLSVRHSIVLRRWVKRLGLVQPGQPGRRKPYNRQHGQTMYAVV